MTRRQRPQDPILHTKRRSSVLLNRERNEQLAWINPNAIGSFSFCFAEYERAEAIRPGLDVSDFCVNTYDHCLELSASRNGWRADKVAEVERGAEEDLDSEARAMELPRNGLRSRA